MLLPKTSYGPPMMSGRHEKFFEDLKVKRQEEINKLRQLQKMSSWDNSKI
jgi:hypothetical protein